MYNHENKILEKVAINTDNNTNGTKTNKDKINAN